MTRGWVRSLFLTVFSYVSNGAPKIVRKLEEEEGGGAEEAVRAAWDMGSVRRHQFDGDKISETWPQPGTLHLPIFC